MSLNEKADIDQKQKFGVYKRQTIGQCKKPFKMFLKYLSRNILFNVLATKLCISVRVKKELAHNFPSSLLASLLPTKYL